MTDPEEEIVVDASSLTQPDLRVVDALARLALNARRQGRQLRIEAVGEPLRELLALAGLTEVLDLDPRLPLECQRQPELREEPRLEEVRDVGDRPA